MLDRRELMKRAAVTALAAGFGSEKAFALDTVTLPFGNGGYSIRVIVGNPTFNRSEPPPPFPVTSIRYALPAVA